MWPYWIMFLMPAFVALHNSRVSLDSLTNRRLFDLNRAWLGITVILTLLVGYRFDVGGDWGNYLRNFEGLRYKNLASVITSGDPGYQITQWACFQFGWGIYAVNLICAALFSLGLLIFCRSLPRPWLALSVAVPYLIIVVAMGYTRQGIAIGLSMLGLVALGRQSIKTFLFWVVLAATFHKSAVLLLPIAALAATRRRIWTVVWVSVITFGVYLAILEKSVDTLYANYIEAEYQSQGALIRLSMNALPAAILIVWRRRFEMTLSQMKLWLWLAVISLGLFALYFVSPASTAIDRVALLMLPLQIAVFSQVPEVFGSRKSKNVDFTIMVLFYYAAVQFVWLNYASHARYWVPYQFYPLIDVW